MTGAAVALGEGVMHVHLDRLLFERGMSVKELAEKIDIHPNNVSRIKNGKVEGVRFETLASICAALGCQPGDLLTFDPHPSSDRRMPSESSHGK